MAKVNKVTPIAKDSIDFDSELIHERRGEVSQLFQNDQLLQTTFIMLLWFTANFVYYGIVLMSTELLNSSEKSCNLAAGNTTDDSNSELLRKNDEKSHICR